MEFQYFGSLFFSFLLPFLAVAQGKPADSEAEFEKKYKWRIRQEILDGTYIPKDLGDAFVQLNQLIDKESKAKFKTASEEEVARKLHFSLGRWIALNWGFYGGSRLSDYLKNIGLHHPDDMSRFLIVTYHRNLKRNALEVKNLVQSLVDARTVMTQERLLKGEVLHKETRKRPQEEGEQE